MTVDSQSSYFSKKTLSPACYFGAFDCWVKKCIEIRLTMNYVQTKVPLRIETDLYRKGRQRETWLSMLLRHVWVYLLVAVCACLGLERREIRTALRSWRLRCSNGC